MRSELMVLVDTDSPVSQFSFASKYYDVTVERLFERPASRSEFEFIATIKHKYTNRIIVVQYHRNYVLDDFIRKLESK